MPEKEQPSAELPNTRYDRPPWIDGGELVPDGCKIQVRRCREQETGREGVIKHRPKGKSLHERFHAEALFMRRNNGRPGILPILDSDDQHGEQPQWYVMPEAKLLADGLRENATLRNLVAACATVAGTLSELAEEGTHHRDIKPANLFWYDGGPVLADFGIAAFAHAPAGLTTPGSKLGPANFIAPEMRSLSENENGEHADVYSLAKTLFVLLHPTRGPYPPDGTHRVDGLEFSLWTLGGGDASRDLGHLLEAATQFYPRDRLTMADFHAELLAWLARHSGEGSLGGGRGQFDYMRLRVERFNRDLEGTRDQIRPCIRRIAQALTSDPGDWTKKIDRLGSECTLGEYGWPPNSEDGFEPDATLSTATTTHQGRRIVLLAVFYNERVCFLCEAQSQTPGSQTGWSLDQQWGPSFEHRPRLPRAGAELEQLTGQVVEWLTDHHVITAQPAAE